MKKPAVNSIYPKALRYWRKPSKARLLFMKELMDSIGSTQGILFNACWDCFPSAELHTMAANLESELDRFRDKLHEAVYPHMKRMEDKC